MASARGSPVPATSEDSTSKSTSGSIAGTGIPGGSVSDTSRAPVDLSLAARTNPSVPEPWRDFVAKLLANPAQRFSTAREALESLDLVQVSTGGRMPSWVAGPLFIIGVFLIVYVAVGSRYLVAPFRLAALVPGLGLMALTWRSVNQSSTVALFWGAIFLGLVFRVIHVGAMVGGFAVAAAAAVWYLAAERKRTKGL